MADDEQMDCELMISRFQRLITELVRGATTRSVFQPWELEILLDINDCALDPKLSAGILRQYQSSVIRGLETGPGRPMKLSEFLQRRKTRRPAME
jgi:hypothetical protein